MILFVIHSYIFRHNVGHNPMYVSKEDLADEVEKAK